MLRPCELPLGVPCLLCVGSSASAFAHLTRPPSRCRGARVPSALLLSCQPCLAGFVGSGSTGAKRLTLHSSKKRLLTSHTNGVEEAPVTNAGLRRNDMNPHETKPKLKHFVLYRTGWFSLGLVSNRRAFGRSTLATAKGEGREARERYKRRWEPINGSSVWGGFCVYPRLTRDRLAPPVV